MTFDELNKLIRSRGYDAFEMAIDWRHYGMTDISTAAEILENIGSIIYNAVEDTYWQTYD